MPVEPLVEITVCSKMLVFLSPRRLSPGPKEGGRAISPHHVDPSSCLDRPPLYFGILSLGERGAVTGQLHNYASSAGMCLTTESNNRWSAIPAPAAGNIKAFRPSLG